MPSDNGPRRLLVYCAKSILAFNLAITAAITSNHSVPDDPGGGLNTVRWRSRMIDARAPSADRLILGCQLGPNHQDPPHENQGIQNNPSQ